MDRDQQAALRSAQRRSGNTYVGVLGSRFAQRGAAIVETLIALPILLVVILAAIQFGLIYQAKATLNHASLQAARAGAVNNASATSIRQGLARGLLPLYSPESSLEGVASTVADINAQLVTDARVRILNPTREAFDDFAEDNDGQREIPNDRLHVRSTAAGNSSALNIQDANVLKVQVTYGYELKVPLVNWLISRVLSQASRGADAFEQQLLKRTRLPILASATVRMQSPARMSELVVARADLAKVERFDANTRPVNKKDSGQQDGEADADEGEPSQEGDRGGSTLGDGFFGFGGGHAQSVTPTEESLPAPIPTTTDQPTEPRTDGGKTAQPEEEEPLCTPSKSDTDGAEEDSGLLGEIWGELKKLAGTAVEFVKGFWDGVKGQLDDLVELVTDPLEVAKGLYQLAKEFIADPPGTAKMIGEAIGKDLQQLVYCGAFDRGRVIGSNVDPAFMLKLATKLAKFGRLANALEDTKRAFGCASFVAGTPIRTESGYTPIERIQAADRVQSRDRTSFDDGPHSVAHIFNRTAPDYVAVLTEAEVLHVTAEHPFWVQGKGWTEVSALRVGQAVATVDGDALILKTIPIDEPRQVFNFSVPDTESYFAGKSGIWVHNANCEIPPIYRAPRSPSGYAIGASDEGSGAWKDITRTSNTDAQEAAYRYQQQITGAPRDGNLIREYRVGNVNFDGYDADRGVLIDAKHFTEICPLADCKPEFLKGKVAEDLVEQAERQINALKSVMSDAPVEWHVANNEMADKIRGILQDQLSKEYIDRISVIFTPDLVN